MSSAHCSHCGAMSTIWLPTCVFCGQPVSKSSPAIKPVSRIRRAVFEDPTPTVKSVKAACTERKEADRRVGVLDYLRLLWARMRHRLAG